MSYEKLYQISFFVATLFALTTYSSNLETIERVYSAKNEAKTSTGVLETKKDWKEDSKEPIRQIKSEKPNCDAECKVETLIKLGITSKLSNLIVSECKEWAIDPIKCIIIASSIVKNESGWGTSNACKERFNCFWVASWSRKYNSLEEWVSQWVSIYSRKWYKAKNSSFFYPDKWEYSPSRYCVSESSSNSEIGCPNWQKHMQNMWNKLDKLF